MSTLNISMLGRMKVSAQEDHSEIRMTHVVQELLSYLVFNRGRSISRELLADLLWGKYEPKHARDSLNTAIWRLRKLFQNSQINDKNYIATSVDNVCFISSGDFYLDIAEYETLWDRIRVNSKELSTQTVRDLNRIIELYKGDLLEGLFIDWVLTERERLRLIYLSCLAELMDFYHSQNAPEKAMEYAQKILTVDPLREDIHREVMQFYLELGQRTMAIRQYKICCSILSEDLNISPMIETQAIYEKAVSNSISKPQSNAIPVTTSLEKKPGPQDAISSVREAVENLEHARNDLCLALQALQIQPDR